MKQEIFLSTGSQDIYSLQLNPIKSYLKKRGFIVEDIVTHGKDCIRVVLESDNEQITDNLIQALRADVINILEHAPNNSWADIKRTHKFLDTFSEVEDVTSEELEKISKAERILQSLELPLKNIPFYAGQISIEEENGIYTISLESSKVYPHDGDEYSVQFQWIFSPGTHDYETRPKTLRNGEEETGDDSFDLKKTEEAWNESSSLERIDFLEVLTHVQGQKKDISANLAFAQKKEHEEKPVEIEEDYFPINTILKTDSIPNWSIVQRLKFSSFDKLREQLDQWKLPYQVINFSKGRSILESLKESPEPQAQITIKVQEEGKDPREYFIVKRASDGEYFDPEHQDEEFTFSGTLGAGENGEVIFNQSHNPQHTSKVQMDPIEEREVALASKAIVSINCPENNLPDNSIKIEGKTFTLTDDQKIKINLSQHTSRFDKVRGNPLGQIISRWIEVHFEFPVDNPKEPILKDVKVVAYKDIYKF